MSEADCIFCKILRKEIPSFKIYENEHVYSFLDINPCTEGHCLVIPKVHAERMTDMTPEAAGQVAAAVPIVAKAVLEQVGATDFNVVVNNGKHSGQMVPHVHFHIVPRKENDGAALKFEMGKPGDMDALGKMAGEIASKF